MSRSPVTPTSELRRALSRFRGAFAWFAVFSGTINILMLSGAIFMLEVYDRVLPSGSVPTLLALVLLTAALFLFQAILDVIRSRMLVRIAISIEKSLGPQVFLAITWLPLLGRHDAAAPLRDVERIRAFIAGGGLQALFDLPWIPVYLAVCFVLHFWIGVTASIGAVLLLSLTAGAEYLTRAPARDASMLASLRDALAESARRNAEAVRAMGLTERLLSKFEMHTSNYLNAQGQANDVSGGLGAASKVLRMMLQSAVLAVGAYLVIAGEATAGIIIAGSILSARALAPVELAIGHWRGFQTARQGAKRLTQLLCALPTKSLPLELPRPTSDLKVESISVSPPGSDMIVVADASFRLAKGHALGIIGPSASGKSSLARALVGVWPTAKGKIRLDDAALELWSPQALGRNIGYLPQNVELFQGTVGENIARFDTTASPTDIIAAAKAAQIHEIILRLPKGYETPIGEGGLTLSAGQRQRLALARALYGEPFLIVLDEPNSNLDGDGEKALAEAILDVKKRGGIAIIISHRPAVLSAVDSLLVLADGRVQAAGGKNDVLDRIRKPSNVAVLGMRS
ncbi:MAG TPA: type I secretion system permease/ATPase [Aestuariivirgaceae bacterium]|jgi:ATP-binding cassette subfamily C protein